MVLGSSLLAVPALLQNQNEANILRQWLQMYNVGKIVAPPFALLSSIAAFGAAYTHSHPQAPYRSRLFIAAGIATLSLVPYTLTVMRSNLSKLHIREENARIKTEKDGDSAKVSEETTILVTTWRNLNFVRGLLPLLGSILAFQAL